MKSTRKIVIGAVLTFLLFVGINVWTYKKVPYPPSRPYAVLYFPKGENMALLTGNFRQFLADVLYLWAIQYYGHYEIKERYDYIYKIFDIITDLDPYYSDAYRLAMLICAFELRDIQKCVMHYSEKGYRYLPDSWEIQMDAAFYCWKITQDFECVLESIDRARRSKTAPPFLHRWYAKTLALKGNLEESLQMWQELYEAGDDFTKRIAQMYVHDLLIVQTARNLERCVAKYHEKFGTYPASLEDTKEIGCRVPLKDSEGRPFRYNPATGDVKPNPKSLITLRGKVLEYLGE